MYIVDFLQSRGIGFETLLHRPAFSATRRARNMRVTGREVAKTVLVKCGDEFVLAVLPATSRIDLARLGSCARGRSDAGPARDRRRDPVDLPRLRAGDPPAVRPALWAQDGGRHGTDRGRPGRLTGNTRHEGLRMQFRDYETLEEPIRADFAVNHSGTSGSPDSEEGPAASGMRCRNRLTRTGWTRWRSCVECHRTLAEEDSPQTDTEEARMRYDAICSGFDNLLILPLCPLCPLW